MKISGFTMVKNATKLYFPVKESILSILPIVDEFVIALGDCDADDGTLDLINSIGSDKIKIVHTVWDVKKYPLSTELAHQTDIAMKACSGDWLFYLQTDEVVHEKYLDLIKQQCEKYLADDEVEGLLFKYKHFWGDFDHFHHAHGWYPNEIRIVKNIPSIHSWRDAQSFRKYASFEDNYEEYYRKEGTQKLKVVQSGAEVYHYGWVRPPQYMSRKKLNHDSFHHGSEKGKQLNEGFTDLFDYGPLNRLPVFEDTHPAVMKEWISKFNWQQYLQYDGGIKEGRPLHKHEKLKNRILTFFEQNLLGGRQIGGFKNYILLNR